MSIKAYFTTFIFAIVGCTQSVIITFPENHPANATLEEEAQAPRSSILDLNSADPVFESENRAPDISHSGDQHGQHIKVTDATEKKSGDLYSCPMHPEVTSKKSDDRCPKCNMKINKPIQSNARNEGTMGNHEGMHQ